MAGGCLARWIISNRQLFRLARVFVNYAKIRENSFGIFLECSFKVLTRSQNEFNNS